MNGKVVTCAYLNADQDSRAQVSYLIIKVDNMTCNVLNPADDCLVALIAEQVVQITARHNCSRVSGSNEVSCLIDLARVREVCCRQNSQIECSTSELTTINYQSL